MDKKLMINQTFDECRMALVENGEVTDFLVDRTLEDDNYIPRTGNIYKGKVVRILPGMQAAFVDIGHKKAAFLHMDDAIIPTEKELEKDRGKRKFLFDDLKILAKSVNMRYQPQSIESFLKEGDRIIVQVIKDPISSKGPRVTRRLALAGRFLVFMPLEDHLGISRRIVNDKEKERLRGIIESIKPEKRGLIARTVAEGKTARTLKADLNVLNKIWKEIIKKTGRSKASHLIYEDLGFLPRTLRDIVDEDIQEIIVDSPINQQIIEKFLARYLPRMKGRTVFYDKNLSLFEFYNIDVEIERGLSNKVFLRSGGYLHIDQTEALVSIDVNTGSFVGKKKLEETILKINMEAIKEIVYQIRLRNCGGLIVIDFIDMEKEENR
ncbi:MAG: Rne/Rng family ribonuclease, partial [Halobacteriovoraceae bacterium]|nr:Rne/Rng family ribonuclease [Halobacteriovoraceae bacterium]